MPITNHARLVRLARALLMAHLLGGLGWATAQIAPSGKPIRLIVPYAAGGTSDILARIIGQKLAAAWKQQVIVENHGGANGNIGSDIVAKAEADGYTLLLGTSGSNAVNPSLYTRMPYDAKRDLALVTPVAVTANIIVANPKFAASNIKELIDLARAKPGKINFGWVGRSTSYLRICLRSCRR